MKKKTIVYISIGLSISIALLFLWINHSLTPLEVSLKLAGKNQIELKTALNYYLKNEIDSQKRRATHYLIENMPGHFSYDSTFLGTYRPAIVVYDSLIKYREKHPELNLINKMDSIWKSFQQNHNIYDDLYNRPVWEDTKYITSEFLIQNINKAFDARKNNPYSDSISATDFFEYVLPYRKQQGLCLEDWRSHFYNDNSDFIKKKYPMPIKRIVDSLLFKYSKYIHTYGIMPNYPYLKLSDFSISKRGECSTKCWFNSMLFASLGIPVTIDFVPNWGNRNDKHQWNALLYNGKTYPFESFWEECKWKYKELYNNKSSDPLYGDFRLAKVFRYSYQIHREGPLNDSSESFHNIPSLFLDFHKKDVSAQYFPTCNVNVRLTCKPPYNVHYAYLCVFSSDQLIPVQWGKIVGTSATFENMGKDIVYLPAYYKDGNLTPAGPPFHLSNDGYKNFFAPDNSSKATIKISRKYPVFPLKKEWAKSLVGGKFQGANRADFCDAVDLYTIDMTPDFIFQTASTNSVRTFRYVRFLFAKGKYGNLAEIKFYTLSEGRQSELHGKMICSNELIPDIISKALDNNIETFIKPYMPGRHTSNQWWVGIDLETKQKISEVGFCPRTDKNNIFPSLSYDLRYWDDGWISLGKKNATANELIYDNVPNNALLILKCLDEGKEERIFTYEDGKQIWW